MARIEAIFEAVQAQGASDLHIATGAPPMIRLHGEMRPVPYQELTRELAEMLLFEIMTDRERETFERQRDVDFSYEIPGKFRVRCNVYEENRGVAGAFRLLPSSILTQEQLGIPAQVAALTELARGLVVVTGPPGSGKSTTLASLIDHINNRQRKHIITIEDPIEYVHQNRNCMINQREIGKHTPKFSSALRAALREDPDIILVGEMRDYETMSLALTAAQTGQLVFGTLHTTSAAETVERIVDMFPSDEQSQARGTLAASLRGVIAQRLLKRADGQGRVVAVEILLGSNAVSALIREKKVHQIPSVIQTSRREGMLLLEDSLAGLVKSGLVTAEEARRFSIARIGPAGEGSDASAAPSPAAAPAAAAAPRASGAAANPGR
jgi:twitching motility protein PilT